VKKLKDIRIRHNTFNVPHIERLHELEGTALAGFRTRAAAFLIDLFIVLLLIVIVNLITGDLTYKISPSGEINLNNKTAENGLHMTIVFAVYFIFITLLWKGRTPGKKIMRIRVISVKSEKLTLWQCVERTLGYGASALEAGFGFLQVIWYENRQAVHDRIAETTVIKLKKKRNKSK